MVGAVTVGTAVCGVAVVALAGKIVDMCSWIWPAVGALAGGTIDRTATNSISAVRSSMPICAAKGSQARQPPLRPARTTARNCWTATWRPTSGCPAVGTVGTCGGALRAVGAALTGSCSADMASV